MSPPLQKRSLVLAGHRTSLALEGAFWVALETAASARGVSLATMVAEIDLSRGEGSLASACRLFALNEARKR